MKQEFTCSGCGSKVLKYLSQLTRIDVVFCTLVCRNKNFKKADPTWEHPSKQTFTHQCINCNKTFITNGSHFNPEHRKYCGRKCQATQPRKPHTEETKAILSQKQIKHCATFGNQFLTGKSKGKHTKEVRDQISANNIGNEPQWKGRIFQYDGPKGKFKLRSSYELFYANWLDEQGIGWKYEPYFKLSTGKSYSPDFQLDDGVIIEVKGYWTEIGLSKWKQFCLDYPEITKYTIMKDDLVELGL